MMSVLSNQIGNEVSKMTLRKFSMVAPVGISCDEASVPSGFRAEDSTNRIGKMRERQREQADQVPPADPAEPAALRAAEPDDVLLAEVLVFPVGGLDRGDARVHQLISSSAWVRRKPMIDTTATIRKMKIEIAAAKPYCAPPPPKASR